jgi:predicted SAM-dependent methyltransferase
MVIDLERDLLPFPDNSVDVVVCMSAINYFTRKRAGEIIKDVYRILKEGGTARFGTQDLCLLAGYYLERNREFYFQKLANGQERFPGRTFADKFNEFFYGFPTRDKHCRYVYDFEALRDLFTEAGFRLVEEKRFQESRILEIEAIDNRPEQMFFLEAVKTAEYTEHDTETNIGALLRKIKLSIQGKQVSVVREGTEYDQAVRLWNSGLHEQAWQCLLKALDDAPGNRMAVVMCADILKKSNRPADLVSLYEKYLSNSTGDFEIRRALEDARKDKLAADVSSDLINQRRILLDTQFAGQNSVQDDKTHLSGCIQWLSVAHDVNNRGGVAACYYLDSERWWVDYPETTGYIIPVFLCYYRLTGNGEYLKRAVSMGDWEISIQYSGGGVGEPIGVYGLKPRIFNTSQVMLGWLALYKETGRDKYLEAAKAAADWIVTNQDTEGNWTRNTYRGPRAYKSRVAWALLELFALTGTKKYQESAERCISWVMDKARPNGWFSHNSLSDPERPWTHLIGYVLVGLLEIYRLNNSSVNRTRMLGILQNAAGSIANFYLKQKEAAGATFVTLAGTFDSAWQSKDNWSCITGTAQLEFFLRRMLRYEDDPLFLKASDMLIEDLKKVHLLDGFESPNMFGGLPGSYPVGVGYCAYSIPNWGVKFFADSLLQRLLPEEDQGFLG